MPNLTTYKLGRNVLKILKKTPRSKIRSFLGVPLAKRLKKERKKLIELIESKTEETLMLLKEAEKTRNILLTKLRFETSYNKPLELTDYLLELADLEQLKMYLARKNCRTIATHFYTIYKELLPEKELVNLKRILNNYEKLNTEEITDFLENHIKPRIKLLSKKAN
jgi:hypothetical protein